jgi:hypothetical protein
MSSRSKYFIVFLTALFLGLLCGELSLIISITDEAFSITSTSPFLGALVPSFEATTVR